MKRMPISLLLIVLSWIMVLLSVFIAMNMFVVRGFGSENLLKLALILLSGTILASLLRVMAVIAQFLFEIVCDLKKIDSDLKRVRSFCETIEGHMFKQ